MIALFFIIHSPSRTRTAMNLLQKVSVSNIKELSFDHSVLLYCNSKNLKCIGAQKFSESKRSIIGASFFDR